MCACVFVWCVCVCVCVCVVCVSACVHMYIESDMQRIKCIEHCGDLVQLDYIVRCNIVNSQ